MNDPETEYDDDYLYLEEVITARDAYAHFRAEERVKTIAQFVSPSIEKRVLDIGIGDGLLLSVAEQAGYATFGLDVNKAGVELAQKEYGLRAEICLEPLEQAFPRARFDVIHMNEVIEHIREPMILLRWCREHLAEHGCLVIQTGNIDSLVSRLKKTNWDYIRPVHVSYFSTRTLSYGLRQSGFNILRCSTVDWHLKSTLKFIGYQLTNEGMFWSLRFALLYLSALWHGLRRTVLIYAT